MVALLKGYRVFVATPGGLDDERQAFRRVLLNFNEDDALERGVVFLPTGWDLTLAGVGRPQELINGDIRRSDYLLLVLWDRWGTPPSVDGEFTSGTEEEFAVAIDCLAATQSPMQDVVVMFKGVSARQLSDPGSQLAKVLAFKRRLEAEKTVLYSTFDSLDEFTRHVQRHAQRWLRDQVREPASGDFGNAVPPNLGDLAGDQQLSATDRPEAADGDDDTLSVTIMVASEQSKQEDDLSTLLNKAEELASSGQLSEAEALFARAVVGRTDRTALARYARFLRRTGRLAKAQEVSEELLSLARETGDAHAEIEALSNSAIIHRTRGRINQARGELAQALKIAESLGRDGLDDLAFLEDNIGLTERKRGAFSAALDAHRRALAIRRGLGESKNVGKSLTNISALLRQRGELDDAVKLQDEALAIFEELKYTRGLAAAYANRGELYELQDDNVAAEAQYEKSLAAHELLGNPENVARNLMQLGRLALRRDDLPLAKTFAARGLASEDSANRPEGTATALQLSGLVLAYEGKETDAIKAFQRASEIYAASDHVIGLAFTLCDLASVYLEHGRVRQAESVVERAQRTAEGVEHVQLWNRLDALSERLRKFRQDGPVLGSVSPGAK
jgi:tetratricopeptide (TPR) repeat protein